MSALSEVFGSLGIRATYEPVSRGSAGSLLEVIAETEKALGIKPPAPEAFGEHGTMSISGAWHRDDLIVKAEPIGGNDGRK